ncbi:MAG: hypothetical protein NW201_12990 [Gemmatimonadales bacterium]|nr:hypothetical protein [Gemmatimonadales bacterium]
MRRADFFLHAPARRPWWAVATSTVLHLLLATVAIIEARVHLLPLARRERAAAAPAEGRTVVMMRYELPAVVPGQRARARVPSRPTPQLGDVAALTPQSLPTEAPVPTATPTLIPQAPRDPVRLPGSTERGNLRPELGDGRVWVKPLPLPPAELAARLGGPRPGRSHAELVDSAVTEIVQAFLDSIAREPGAALKKPPRWTAEYAGKTWGIDKSTIYLGDLKIPAAVLAFLPLTYGNPDQIIANRMMEDMRRDLNTAAQRSANLAEFKRQIRELRERRESEREFERNRGTAPGGNP